MSPFPFIADPASTALGRGIQHLGKQGNRPLPPDLLEECRQVLLSGAIDQLQKGAFLGALLAKGPRPEEQPLEAAFGKGAFLNPTFFINKVCPDLPTHLFPIATKLLKGHILRSSEAHQLGNFLFLGEECETFKGMAVSILNTRTETNAEYKGLYDAAMETITPGFQQLSCVDRPLVQLAEPFDGVEHSYLITPLLAIFFGRNSGILCAVRTARGHLFYQHFGADLPAFAEYRTESDEIVTNLQVDDNLRLIRDFMNDGTTSNEDFNNRVHFTLALVGRENKS